MRNLNIESLRLQKENDIYLFLLGPNVLGLINTENSMNASFASKMPEEGGIYFYESIRSLLYGYT